MEEGEGGRRVVMKEGEGGRRGGDGLFVCWLPNIPATG